MALTQDEYDKLMNSKRSFTPSIANQSGQPLCIHCRRLEEAHVGAEKKCFVTGITRFCSAPQEVIEMITDESSDAIEMERRVREVWSRRHDQHLQDGVNNAKCPFCRLVADVQKAEPGTHPTKPVSVQDLLNAPKFIEALDRQHEHQKSTTEQLGLKFNPGVQAMTVQELHNEWEERGKQIDALRVQRSEALDKMVDRTRELDRTKAEMVLLHNRLSEYEKQPIANISLDHPIPMLLVAVAGFLAGAAVMFFAS